MSPSPTSSPVYFVYPCFSSLFQSFLCIIFTHSPLSLPNNLQVLLFPEIALSLYSVFPLSFLVLLYPQVTIHFMHGLSFPISTTVHFIYPFSSFLYQSFIYPYFSFLYKSSASFVRSLALFLSSFLCLSVLPAPPSLCLFCGFDFLSALLSSFLPLELLYPNLSGPHSPRLSLLLARSPAPSLPPPLSFSHLSRACPRSLSHALSLCSRCSSEVSCLKYSHTHTHTHKLSKPNPHTRRPSLVAPASLYTYSESCATFPLHLWNSS